MGRVQRSNFQGRPRGGVRKKRGQGQEVGGRKSLHPLPALLSVGPQTSIPVPRPATRPPDLGARARAPLPLPGPRLRLHSSAPPHPPAPLTSRLQPPPLLLGCGSEGGLRAPPTWGPSQGPGQGLAPGRPGPRRCGRGGESRGIPGGEGSRARRPGVGSGTGVFSLFRCLKLAPAERCGHVTERRQSAAVLVSAFRARKPRRPRGAAAGTPPGG